MRYDAAIIGAGAEGLAAAALLGQAGLRVLVIERHERVGGRCLTREFHPGFRASPFVDELAEIPAEIYWALDLACHGAVFTRPRFSLALWPDRGHLLRLDESCGIVAMAARSRAAIAARVSHEAAMPRHHPFFERMPKAGANWPAAEWTNSALADAASLGDADENAHLAALALSGRVADPALAGSAVHLLGAGADGGRLRGGLGRLADALFAAAQAAGAEFSLGLEVSDIRRRDGRIVGVGLADGSEIATRSVISTLDLKRSFLTFFPWNALPKPVIRRVSNFRMAGSVARVLFALDCAPALPKEAAAGTAIQIAPDLARMGEAHQAWRAGIVAENLPVTLRIVSDGDPSLAPASASVVTATLGAIPFRLFDGAWTHEKRELLRARALAAVQSVCPGFAAHVIASEVAAPPDIEDALGATDGDLAGGEIAPDQMLGAGPWGSPALPRTPIGGFYLAGSNLTAGAFATCAAGAAAAHALLADRGQGRIK